MKQRNAKVGTRVQVKEYIDEFGGLTGVIVEVVGKSVLLHVQYPIEVEIDGGDFGVLGFLFCELRRIK